MVSTVQCFVWKYCPVLYPGVSCYTWNSGLSHLFCAAELRGQSHCSGVPSKEVFSALLHDPQDLGAGFPVRMLSLLLQPCLIARGDL